MRRLDREFHRLFQAEPPGVRALLLEVARPAQWPALAAVWQGVQADLGWPAPAIAANGVDGLQLWFSLAQPVDPAQGLALLEHLRSRHLPQVPLHRVALLAEANPTPVPRPGQPGSTWAAFVAADLAPLFEDTPWLDLPPNDDGQADLLSRLASVPPAAWAAAVAALSHVSPPAAAVGPGAPAPVAATAAHAQASAFLLQVMNDPAAPLALRVEAAKALLPPR